MLSKPDPSFLRSLIVVSRQPAWQAIDKALNAEIQALYERLAVTRESDVIYQLQGRVQALSGLLELVQTAPEILDRLTKGER